MDKDKVLELLKNDSEYYSGVGRNYLSNSDISSLISNPKSYGVPRDDSKELLQGRILHQILLEPDKPISVPVLDTSSRLTKEYRDYIKENKLDIVLLKSEFEEAKKWSSVLYGNISIYDEIYAHGNLYETPAIGEIDGVMWKGKADIITDSFVVDIKTTSDISKFNRNARTYNYDSQAFIYNKLFGKPMKFIVICKSTLQVGIFNTHDSFLESGRDKVLRAISVYEKYFGPKKTDDIDNYIIESNLF